MNFTLCVRGSFDMCMQTVIEGFTGLIVGIVAANFTLTESVDCVFVTVT